MLNYTRSQTVHKHEPCICDNTTHTHTRSHSFYSGRPCAGLQVQVQIESKQAAGAVPRQPERQAGHSRHARPAAGLTWPSWDWACRRRARRHHSAGHEPGMCTPPPHPGRPGPACPGPRQARDTQEQSRRARGQLGGPPRARIHAAMRKTPSGSCAPRPRMAINLI